MWNNRNKFYTLGKEAEMNTEKRCRIICKSTKQNPDGIAQGWNGVPKPKEAGNGPVLYWMTWISTVERKPRPDTQDKSEEQQKANLQRQIDESEPNRKITPKYSCYE